MTITINRAALAQAMAQLARSVQRRNTIPILSNVRMSIAGNSLTLTATDLDMEAKTTLPCDNPGGVAAATTTSAHLLNDILKKLPEGTLTLTRDWQNETAALELKMGRSRFQLRVLPAADFPDLDAGTMAHTFTLESRALLQAMKPITFAICDQEARHYLNGIYLHAQADKLIFVATDGHQLARTTMALPEDAQGLGGIIIPRHTVTEIIRLAEEEGGTITIEASTQKLRFKAGDTILTTKLIDGTYPDYERVIPQENPITASLKRETLAEAVARVAVVSAEKSRGLALEFGAEKLTLTMANPDAGTAVEDVDASYEAEPLRIGFNASYLSEILGVLKGDDVSIALRDAGSPVILTSAVLPDLTIVLMPMRLMQ